MDKKGKLRNWLFKIKILYRNFKAKPIRLQSAENSILTLKEMEGEKSKIFFCGIPIHKNMGDQAQRYCIENWCKMNYPDYYIVPIPTWAFYEKDFRSVLEKTVKKDDLFVIQSGYCTTSRHYDHPMHRYIVSKFKNNKILIMPQTVRFVEKRDAKKTAEIYNRHPNLLFLARDKISYESAKNYFDRTKVFLYPDIVTTLIGTMRFKAKRDGVLICVRNDGEKKFSNEQIQLLKQYFDEREIRCNITDTNSNLSLDELVENFSSELSKTLEQFASYEVVITDRYHGTIFSMIANTPVVVLETRDHKVKTGTEWFKGIYDDAYKNAVSLDNAKELAIYYLRKKTLLNNPAYFKEQYYDKLKVIFEGE